MKRSDNVNEYPSQHKVFPMHNILPKDRDERRKIKDKFIRLDLPPLMLNVDCVKLEPPQNTSVPVVSTNKIPQPEKDIFGGELKGATKICCI